MFVNMKLMIVFVVILGAAMAAPLDDVIPILKSSSEMQPDGSYAFRYESGDGTMREEEGEVMNPNTDEEYVMMKGSYMYKTPEGNTVEVMYTADDTGYHPRIKIMYLS